MAERMKEINEELSSQCECELICSYEHVEWCVDMVLKSFKESFQIKV